MGSRWVGRGFQALRSAGHRWPGLRLGRRSRAAALSLALLLGCSPPSGAPGAASGPSSGPSGDGQPDAASVPPPDSRQIDRLFLVTLDTLRADHLGAYGYPLETSPFLDAMAEAGVLFERAYAPMSTTVPSHATLFTSLYPIQHGVTRNGQVLGAEFLTLAEVLRDRGFQTAGFVATESQFGPGALDQGFETFEQKRPDAETYRPADETVDAALTWLEGADPGRPLFLWVHLFDAHGPLIPPKAHLERFALHTNAERNALLAFLVNYQGARPRSFARGMRRMLDENAKYDAEIHFADGELRRLYEAVARLGLAGRSLWIFVGDHGEGMTRRPRLGHGRHIFQEQIHVPLIVRASAGLFAPRRVTGVVEHTDLLPTVAELVGASDDLKGQEAPVQGRSLVPLLRGEPGDPERAALVQRRSYHEPNATALLAEYELGEKLALVGEEWKLIHRTIGGDALYHLASDPNEDRNLIDELPARAAAMQGALLERVDALRATAPGEAPSVDADTLGKLEAMGYVE